MLPHTRLPIGDIRVEWVIDLSAHEIHHSGLYSTMEQHMREITPETVRSAGESTPS